MIFQIKMGCIASSATLLSPTHLVYKEDESSLEFDRVCSYLEKV